MDADATPNPVKEILFRASTRTRVPLVLVANQYLKTPAASWIRAVQVPAGIDVADNYIVQNCKPDDLVITADIPLAAEIIPLGAAAINPRGETYTKENIRQRLNMRDFMDTLRSTGIQTGGPSAFGTREKQAFAGALDRWLARAMRV